MRSTLVCGRTCPPIGDCPTIVFCSAPCSVVYSKKLLICKIKIRRDQLLRLFDKRRPSFERLADVRRIPPNADYVPSSLRAARTGCGGIPALADYARNGRQGRGRPLPKVRRYLICSCISRNGTLFLLEPIGRRVSRPRGVHGANKLQPDGRVRP